MAGWTRGLRWRRKMRRRRTPRCPHPSRRRPSSLQLRPDRRHRLQPRKTCCCRPLNTYSQQQRYILHRWASQDCLPPTLCIPGKKTEKKKRTILTLESLSVSLFCCLESPFQYGFEYLFCLLSLFLSLCLHPPMCCGGDVNANRQFPLKEKDPFIPLILFPSKRWNRWEEERRRINEKKAWRNGRRRKLNAISHIPPTLLQLLFLSFFTCEFSHIFPFCFFSLKKIIGRLDFFTAPFGGRREAAVLVKKMPLLGPRFDFLGKGKEVRLVVPPFYKKNVWSRTPTSIFWKEKKSNLPKKEAWRRSVPCLNLFFCIKWQNGDIGHTRHSPYFFLPCTFIQ